MLLSAWTPPLTTFIIGTGQDVGVGPADVAVQREIELGGGRLGDGQARAEDGVGAEPGLVVGAVEVAQLDVDQSLLEGIDAAQRRGDLAVDVADCGCHTLAEVSLAAIAQFDRLVLAGRCARRHRGAPAGSALQLDFDLDGGVAAGVEDLTADDADDLAHRGTVPGDAPLTAGLGSDAIPCSSWRRSCR